MMDKATPKPETERRPATTGDLRAALLNLAAAANDALYRSYASEEDTCKGYAEALDSVRKILFEPAALASLGWLVPVPAPQKRDWLDLGDFRLSRYHAGDITLFVGAINFDGDDHNGHIYEISVRRDGPFPKDISVLDNGVTIASAILNVGDMTMAENVGMAMLHAICARNRNRRHHKAAAEVVEPIEPSVEIPPRPGLPEDDE